MGQLNASRNAPTRRITALTRFRSIVGVAAISALALTGAAPATAAVGDGQLGGPPDASGVADDTLCSSGAVTGVSGVTRNLSGWIPIVVVATVSCSDGSAGVGTMGSGDGDAGSTSCPAGQVAIGIDGREGDFLDLLSLRCQNADGSGAITTSAGWGGGHGGDDGPYDCPQGMVLTGLRGQSVFDASSIRYVEPVCGTVMVDEDGDGIQDTDPPADKASCKNGGWSKFNNPSFRNQGECVKYTS